MSEKTDYDREYYTQVATACIEVAEKASWRRRNGYVNEPLTKARIADTLLRACLADPSIARKMIEEKTPT